MKFNTINDSILKLKIHSQVTFIKFSPSCSIIIVKLRDNVSGHFISSRKQARRNEVEVRCFNRQCIRRYFKKYPCHFQFFNFTLQIIISISEVTSEFHFQDYNLNVRSVIISSSKLKFEYEKSKLTILDGYQSIIKHRILFSSFKNPSLTVRIRSCHIYTYIYIYIYICGIYHKRIALKFGLCER